MPSRIKCANATLGTENKKSRNSRYRSERPSQGLGSPGSCTDPRPRACNVQQTSVYLPLARQGGLLAAKKKRRGVINVKREGLAMGCFFSLFPFFFFHVVRKYSRGRISVLSFFLNEFLFNNFRTKYMTNEYITCTFDQRGSRPPDYFAVCVCVYVRERGGGESW